MSIYNSYIFDDYILSPVNGFVCKRLTSQNIKKFGFNSIKELHQKYPDFPTSCISLQNIYKNASRKGAENLNKIKKQQENNFVKLCKNCNTQINYNNKNNLFCSKSCSVSFNNKNNTVSKKQKQKTSNTLKTYYKKKYNNNPKMCKKCNCFLPYDRRKLTYCFTCQPIPKIKKVNDIKLCKNCSEQIPKRNTYCGKCLTTSRHYRSLCSFKFNVYHYPNEFDLKLLNTYGWYSPTGKNKTNKNVNLNGVSRDHLYTVSDGFKNKRDPNILSHPANCKLLIHNGPNGNNSKKQSSITWDELLKRIEIWNKKYLK